MQEPGDERGGRLGLLPCREVARVVHDRKPSVRRAVGERLAVGAREEAVVRAPDHEGLARAVGGGVRRARG